MQSRLPLAALLSTFALVAGAARAQTPGFNAQRFEPAAGASGGFMVERALVPEHLGYSFGLFLNYADDPLVARGGDGSILSRPVDYAFTADLLASLALFDFAEIAVDLPVHLAYGGDPLDVGGQVFQAGGGIGDLRVIPKVAFSTRGRGKVNFAFGAAVPFTLPTGSGDALRGAGGVTAEPKLLFGLRGTRWGLALNGGFRLRPDADTTQLAGNEVTFGAGGSYAVLPRRDLFDVLVEVVGGKYLSPNRPDVGTLPLELFAGAALKPHPDWSVYLGGGPGLGDGLGSPDVRLIGGVRFSPNPTTDYRDSDNDGVADAFDRCPKRQEDQDGFADDDGCPEDDNDRDGVPDDDDECPDTPEGKNGDGDGCPDDPVVYFQNGKIVIVGKVQFMTGSSNLQPKSEKTLDRVAAVLKEHPEFKRAYVDGHTDETGSAGLNQGLSEQRAARVRQGLIERGVSPQRLSARGFGESRPLAPNTTKAGRAKNRRVEFTVQ